MFEQAIRVQEDIFLQKAFLNFSILVRIFYKIAKKEK